MQEVNHNLPSEVKAKRRHFTREARNEHVSEWRNSGLTMSEYCRQYTLSLSSLSAWIRSSQREHKPAKPAFKPVSILSKTSSDKAPSSVEISVDHRIKVRLFNINNTLDIITLIKGLMSCS